MNFIKPFESKKKLRNRIEELEEKNRFLKMLNNSICMDNSIKRESMEVKKIGAMVKIDVIDLNGLYEEGPQEEHIKAILASEMAKELKRYIKFEYSLNSTPAHCKGSIKIVTDEN